MTHDENRISDLIDGGLHDKSAIDIAKYELHMRRIAAIEEAAKNDTGGWYEQQAFIRGAQHVIEHPERYGLITQDKALQSYSDQQNAELREKLASEIESREHWQRQTQRYQKYHKELNAALERVKELEGEVNRTIDNLHMEIHVMITDARIAVTKLGIDHDKSEAVDRLLYDLDVLQGKMMDAFKTKETK